MENVEFRMDLSDIEALVRSYPEASKRARESRITEALALLEAEIKPDTPWGAGPIHLRDSIFTEVRHEGRKVGGVIGTPLAHGEPVEFGTKPHFPPIDPLAWWAEKKLGLSGDAARSAAFAIAHSIARRGTEGHAMFRDNFDQHKNRVHNILARIAEDIVRMTGGAS